MTIKKTLADELDLNQEPLVSKATTKSTGDSANPAGISIDSLSNFQIAEIFATMGDNRVVLVPIGFPQAGKSLMISSLLYYADKEKNPHFSTKWEEKGYFVNGLKVSKKMIQDFESGRLYKATKEGTLDLIGMSIEPPKASGLKNLDLAILDLAGEDLKKIKWDEGGEFTSKINAIFKGLQFDESPIIFLLITPCVPAQKDGESMQEAHQREDDLHREFLNYIQVSQPDLAKNALFFIVVSQWDKNPDQQMSEQVFIEKYRPAVYGYVQNRGNVHWGTYTVGKILVLEEDDKTTYAKIIKRNLADPKRFWYSLYEICRKKPLVPKPGFWEKLLG
jgi:hypothetical protein